MASQDKVVVYEDDHGFLPAGQIFYPESLRLISPALAELNKESMHDMESYSANVGMELSFIVGFFRSIHETHQAALRVYERYRMEGRQYCLYLRSFDWSGNFTDNNISLAPLDKKFRKFLKESLPPDIAIISFVNMRDLHPGGESTQSADYMAQTTIPSLRVLSHNWREVVREVIRGARLVILNTWGERAEGLTYEANLISECQMESRTILTGSGISNSGILSTGRFASVIDRGKTWFPLIGAEASRLAEAIRALSVDSFMQTNQVRDLSELPCWALDRNIAMAENLFSADELTGVPYDYYIPSSLMNNWTTLTDISPRMIDNWKLIEARLENEGQVEKEQIFHSLDAAAHVFWVAATLERYYEMAISLSVMGMAHKLITGKFDMMVDCYAHAAKCAQWSGDSTLSAFLTNAHSKLKQEAAEAEPRNK